MNYLLLIAAFLPFVLVDIQAAKAIDCSSPVWSKHPVCDGEDRGYKKSIIRSSGDDIDGNSDLSSIVKDRIFSSSVLIENSGNPGSGVIIKKENNTYFVLTAAHVVCPRRKKLINTEEFGVRTADKNWHDSYSGAKLKVICPPFLKGQEKASSLCISSFSEANPWPIDLAILKFQSKVDYPVASNHSRIKRNGFNAYVGGYPVSKRGTFSLFKSDGPANLPPQSIQDTCKGYGVRYIVPTEVGMSGGGIWSDKGRLIGIHGYREVSRNENIALSAGSISSGIHLPYWESMVDPFDPSKGFPTSPQQDSNSNELDVAALISRARALINVSRLESINNNSNLVMEEVDIVLSYLQIAEKKDLQQPLIPALIAQVYIRKYEDGEKNIAYLVEALSNINKSIDLSRKWTRSYDGRFEKVRAHIHFLRGLAYKDNSYLRKAVIDITTRLSKKPNDISAWKEKANYHFYENDLFSSLQSLEKAKKLDQDDPSILIDIAIVNASNRNISQSCSELTAARKLITKLLDKQGEQGAFAEDYLKQNERAMNLQKQLECQ